MSFSRILLGPFWAVGWFFGEFLILLNCCPGLPRRRGQQGLLQVHAPRRRRLSVGPSRRHHFRPGRRAEGEGRRLRLPQRGHQLPGLLERQGPLGDGHVGDLHLRGGRQVPQSDGLVHQRHEDGLVADAEDSVVVARGSVAGRREDEVERVQEY